jgi:hypothetical protein
MSANVLTVQVYIANAKFTSYRNCACSFDESQSHSHLVFGTILASYGFKIIATGNTKQTSFEKNHPSCHEQNKTRHDT